jgi:DNA-binding SARP family transcriptional activator
MSAQVTMLGGFSMTDKGNTISDEMNRTHKLWNILSFLVVHRDRMVPQAEFLEQFWPEEDGTAPINALKTQLYRIRSMLRPLFGSAFQPIVSQRGGYQWNPAIQTEVDIDEFAFLCQRTNRPDTSVAKQEALLKEAIELYKGDFLPKLSNSMWVGKVSDIYHNLYLQAVTDYAEILEKNGFYEEIIDMMQKATVIYPLDEKLHTSIIRSFLNLGKNTAALAHYEYATDLLYRNFGVQHWQELRELYDQIMATEQVFETDLAVIQQDLRETSQRTGAFFCEYGNFREIYRLEARRSIRSGSCIHIVLITVLNADGSVPSLKILNKTMEQLFEVIAQTLRSGDVVTRYSSAQYAIMLPDADLDESEMVVGRLLSQFRRRHRTNQLKISSRIREIELFT